MEYLRNFKNLEDARACGRQGLRSPHTDTLDNYDVLNYYETDTDKFTCEYDDNGRIIIDRPVPPVSTLDPVYFNITSGQVTIPSGTYEYSFDNTNWTATTAGQSLTQSFYLRGVNGTVGRFTITGNVGLEGNAMSLIDYTSSGDTVPAYGFQNTFCACTGIASISSNFLPATTLNNNCYTSMFFGCGGLKTLPSDLLPATTLAKECYKYMFNTCSGLTTIPEGFLPATTLAEGCYEAMFTRCIWLTSTPENLLPATTLANKCYYQMFSTCYELTSAPHLPAETLVANCYNMMFNMCSSLAEIHCDATNISATTCLYFWTVRVSTRGDFYGKTAANWPSGTSGIPDRWTRHLT